MLMYSSGQDTRSQESGSELDVSASSPSACEEPPLEATYQRHVFTLFGFSRATTFFLPCFKGVVWVRDGRLAQGKTKKGEQSVKCMLHRLARCTVRVCSNPRFSGLDIGSMTKYKTGP